MTNPWDSRFLRCEGYLYGEHPNAWIAEQLPVLPVGAKVLALADGEGRNAVWLARQGYQVINCDYSQVGLDKTQALAARCGVHVDVRCMDLVAEALPERYFDAVVSSFFHVPRAVQTHVWSKVLATMKPSAPLVVQVFDQAQLPLTSGGPKDPDLLYCLTDWQQILQDMKTQVLCEATVVLDEGELHQGVAKVINIKSMK